VDIYDNFGDNLAVKKIIILTLFISTPTFADTVYGYCVSTWYLLPRQLSHTQTISSCFKSSSILNNDAGNIALSYCQKVWGPAKGLAIKDRFNSPEDRIAAEAVYMDEEGKLFLDEFECEKYNLDQLNHFNSNSSTHSIVGYTGPIMRISNGVVVSKISALWMTTIRYFCHTQNCR